MTPQNGGWSVHQLPIPNSQFPIPNSQFPIPKKVVEWGHILISATSIVILR
jgi:hypothetical protein